jgi:hypothetical protein
VFRRQRCKTCTRQCKSAAALPWQCKTALCPAMAVLNGSLHCRQFSAACTDFSGVAVQLPPLRCGLQCRRSSLHYCGGGAISSLTCQAVRECKAVQLG